MRFRSLCWFMRAAVLLPALLCAVVWPAHAQSDEEELQEMIDETKRTAELERTPLFERSEDWLCIPAKRLFCSTDTCDAIALDDQVYVELKDAGKTYTRCAAGGCTDLAAVSQSLGIFTLVDVPNAGAFIKIVNDGSKFMNLSTRGFAVWISFGKCLPK